MNKRVALLAAIYDNTFQRIENKITSHNKNYNDPMVIEDIRYLAVIVETMINVIRIEKARAPSGTSTADIPQEKLQPDLKPNNAPNNPPKFGPGDFSGFPSPGGWDPNF